MAKSRSTQSKPRRAPKGNPRSRAPKLTKEQVAEIDHLHVETLRLLVTDRGKIRPRRATGLDRAGQSRAARSIKRARELALLPYPHARMIPMPGRETEEKPERGRGSRDRGDR